jgi:lipoprotein-anchoring transpeptidase ErfK/SrfK
VLGIIVGLLIIAYGVTAYYFSSHFGFNTSIDNVNCTFKTVEEVEQTISDHVDDYELRITGRDGLSKNIKASEVALAYVSDGQVKAILESQNPLLWIARLFRDQSEATTHASVKFDEQKLKTVVDRFDLFNAEKMRVPVDAYAEFGTSEYVIHPEDLGSTFEENRVRDAISDAIGVLEPTTDLDKEGCYAPPKIFANNPDLIALVKTYNTYVPFSITYTFGDQTEVLDAKIALEWFDIAADDTGTLNEDALIAWARDFGLRHDTVGVTRTFTAATGEEATVEGGTYGWEVDEEAEIDAIKAAIVNHTGETREPYYVQRAAGNAAAGQADWGTTYIELDLTNQHMYYFVDGAIEFEADVVTGAPWGGRATPAGVYSILEKLSPTTLRGEIQASGKPEYETPVSYWMRMTWAGHGFHDATWQPAFGGSRYTYAGSHGCINMAYSSAQTLYGILEVGTPVISHY